MDFGIAVLSLLASLVIYGAVALIYNVTFHPLAQYPGPLLWRMSRIPYVYYLLNGCLHVKLLDAHKQYGAVVRLAPDELAFTSAQAWKNIYGKTSATSKFPELPKFQKFYANVGEAPNIITEPTTEGHRSIRHLIARGFSDKSMRSYEPLLKRHVELLVHQLEAHALDENGNKVPLEMRMWYTAATFDIVSDFILGEPFGSLANGELDPWIREVSSFTRFTASFVAAAYSPFQNLIVSFGRFVNDGNNFTEPLLKMLTRRLARKDRRPDIMDHLLDSEGKPYLDDDRMFENATALVLAGSRTTSDTLGALTYLLITHPDCLRRATDEVRSNFKSTDELTLESVSSLPYLQAAISETFRRRPAGPFGLPRIIPEGGATIDGKSVPQNTIVAVWHHTCGLSLDNFTRPTEFIPERWLKEDAQFANDKLDSVQSFSYGARDCVGRNLAQAELRLIMASILLRLNIELVQKDVDWLDHPGYVVWDQPPLYIYATPVGK